jgi:hypothetical protein
LTQRSGEVDAATNPAVWIRSAQHLQPFSLLIVHMTLAAFLVRRKLCKSQLCR